MSDLRLKRKSIEVARLEHWLSNGPRWFVFRHERALRPLLRTALRLSGLLARGQRNARSPVVREVRCSLEGLPAAFCGFRLLHLSDLHVDGTPGLSEGVAALLETLPCDLCAMTGDYRFENYGPCHNVYPGMRRILEAVRARHGILAVLGNHDYAEEAAELETMGARMLFNAAVEIRHNGASLWVAGVDDPWDYQCADLALAASAIPAGAFRVLLVHSPDLIAEAEAAGFGLYLCGHTHAGQIRLPGLGALLVPADCRRRFLQGAWRHGRMQGYTSAGVGCSLLDVRFWCPPEIVVLELRCARHAEGAACHGCESTTRIVVT